MFINYNVFAQLLIALRPSKALFWFIDVYTSGSCTYVLIFLSVAGARAPPYSRRIKKLDRRRLRNKFTQQIPVGKSRHEKNRSRTSDFHVLITESISIARKHAPRSKKYLRDQTTGHVRVLLSFFPFLLSFYIKSDNFLLLTNYSVILATQRNACSFVLVLHLASFTSFSLLSVLRFNALASSLRRYFYFPFSHHLFRYLLWVSYLLPLPFHLTFISNPYATSLHFPPHTLPHTHTFLLYPCQMVPLFLMVFPFCLSTTWKPYLYLPHRWHTSVSPFCRLFSFFPFCLLFPLSWPIPAKFFRESVLARGTRCERAICW